MGNALRYLNLVLLIVVFGALSAGVPIEAADSQEEILVGRIAHVEGKLLRYIEEDKDWVLTVRDSPFAALAVLNAPAPATARHHPGPRKARLDAESRPGGGVEENHRVFFAHAGHNAAKRGA